MTEREQQWKLLLEKVAQDEQLSSVVDALRSLEGVVEDERETDDHDFDAAKLLLPYAADDTQGCPWR